MLNSNLDYVRLPQLDYLQSGIVFISIMCNLPFVVVVVVFVPCFKKGSERRAATSSGTQHMKIVQACLDRWYQKQQGGKGEASNFVDSVHGSISGAAETATDQLSTRAAAERSAVR